jgi:anti-sigma regulatory factor (Ser/Thr protein kinase)
MVAVMSVPATGTSAHIALDNVSASIAASAQWLEDGAERLELSSAMVFKLQLCLEEALANLVNYAFPDGGRHAILLTVTNLGETVLMSLEDDGVFYDPTQQPEKDFPTTLEDAEIGGLGIHLMRQFSQAMSYDRVGDRNRLTLTLSNAEE